MISKNRVLQNYIKVNTFTEKPRLKTYQEVYKYLRFINLY